MTQATLPWVERSPDFWSRIRLQAQALLLCGGGAMLVVAVFGVALLIQGRDDGAVFWFTVAAPIGFGALLPLVVGGLIAGGLIRRGGLLALIVGGHFIGAGIVNYVIIEWLKFDAYVFGILLLLVLPALGCATLLTGFLAVTFYRVFALVLPRVAPILFFGGVAALLVVVPWLHALVFEFINGLMQGELGRNEAMTFFGGGLTIAELSSVSPILADRWRFVAYLLWPLQFDVVRDIVCLGGVLGFINVIPLFAIWWERKVSGRIQSRLGPMRVGGWHGWAQSFADGIKLIFKEDFVPPQGDRALFRLAPYLTFVPAVCGFIALPFATLWVFRSLDVALVFILAMLGIEVVGVIIAGWASNNKWSVYGSMREACQMVSYEIPMGMALLIPVMTAGTLSLTTIVDDPHFGQTGGFWTWLVFRNPFCFAAALVYFVASLASCKRAPFDLPESESELVAGFLTEYSGFRWCLFFFAEYAAMYVVCGLCTILFFGGWSSPLPASWALTGESLVVRAANGVLFSGPLWFVLKSGLLLYVQIWVRWTLPRIRIDQVLYACIQVMLPLTMLLLLGNTFWILLEQQGWGWFAALAGIVNWALAAFGVIVLAVCLYWIVHGYVNNRRLVGTLAIEHLPGA